MTPLVRRYAIRFGFVEQGGGRRIHRQPTPRLGGIAIMTAFYAPLVVLALIETGTGKLFYKQVNSALGLMIAGLVIGALGVYDDLKGADAKKKFAVQILLAIGLYAVGFRIDQIATPFGGVIPLGVFGAPFTVLWIVGVINAMNLIDGLDGLAGGVALFAVGTTFILAFARGDVLMMLFMACLGGALVGFLFYNFNPASIFMGDTGSMFLGLVLAVTSLQTSQKASTAVAILIPIVVLALPIADTVLAMMRRAYLGRPIFLADREHIHHKLLDLGLSHRMAVLILWSMCVLLAAVALVLTYASSGQAAMLLAFLIAVFVVGARMLGIFRSDGRLSASQRRRHNRGLRSAVRGIGRELSDVSIPDDIWNRVRPISEILGVRAMTLTLLRTTPDGDESANRFSLTDIEATGESEPINLETRASGSEGVAVSLILEWTDGRARIDRDIEFAAEFLCDHACLAWVRVLEQENPSTQLKVYEGGVR